MYEKTFSEGSIWVYGGLLLSATSVILLLCGRGWRRVLLEVAAFAELYFWFSWLMFAVMVDCRLC